MWTIPWLLYSSINPQLDIFHQLLCHHGFWDSLDFHCVQGHHLDTDSAWTVWEPDTAWLKHPTKSKICPTLKWVAPFKPVQKHNWLPKSLFIMNSFSLSDDHFCLAFSLLFAIQMPLTNEIIIWPQQGSPEDLHVKNWWMPATMFIFQVNSWVQRDTLMTSAPSACDILFRDLALL